MALFLIYFLNYRGESVPVIVRSDDLDVAVEEASTDPTWVSFIRGSVLA